MKTQTTHSKADASKPTERGPLKKAVQRKFGSIALTKEQLQKLYGVQSTNSQTSDKRTLKDPKLNIQTAQRWIFFALSTACSVIFLAILLQFTDTKRADTKLSHELVQKIANEVAYNHLKLKPLEVTSNSLLSVSDYFTELEFSPVASSLFAADHWHLLGARYCSIQGRIAAQIRFQNTSNQSIETLYETEYSPNTHADFPIIENGDKPISVFAKGILVEIWIEKGLLMAKTSASQS